MTTKRKFLNVIPQSPAAKEYFVNFMSSLHGVVVEKETDDKLFLTSINNKCSFFIEKDGNEHWKIIK